MPLGPVHRHQGSGSVEVVLGEPPVGAGHEAGQLVRVHGAPAGGALHLLPVVVQRGQRLGRRRAHVHPDVVAGVKGGPHVELGQVTGRGALAGHEVDFFQARAGRGRPDPVDEGSDLLAGQLDRRPDVDHDPVGVEPLVLRPLRLDGADRVEAARQDVFQGGQRDEAAVRLAQRRQVADLAHRDQPLVGGVALSRGLEQVDLFVRRRQPGEVERAQPVQLQPLGDLRVQAPDELVFREPRGTRAEGEAVPHGRAAGAGHGKRDPRQPRRPGQQLAEAHRERVRVRLPRPRDVQVGHHSASRWDGPPVPARAGRSRSGERPQGGDRVGKVREVGGRGGYQGPLGDGGEELAAVNGARGDVGQLLVAVVAAGQHLKQRPVVRAPRDPLAEQPDEGLGAGHDRLNPLGAVSGQRTGGEVAQLLADLEVHLGAVAAQQRLGEPAEHHAAREVGDGGEAQLGGLDQVLKGEPGLLPQRLGGRRGRQPLPQQLGDGGSVGGHPLLGEEDAEDSRLELRGPVEAGDAVVAEDPRQLRLEGLWHAGPFDVEAAQVAVEVLAGAVHRPLGRGLKVAARPVAGQL